jgi:hypothetical protein
MLNGGLDSWTYNTHPEFHDILCRLEECWEAMLLGHSHSLDYETFAEYEGRLRSSLVGE